MSEMKDLNEKIGNLKTNWQEFLNDEVYEELDQFKKQIQEIL